MNEYLQGSLVHLSAKFTDATTGDTVHPTSVVLRVIPPSGAEQEFTPDQQTDGSYTHDQAATTAGWWSYRFEASGDHQAVAEASYLVTPSKFRI